MKLASYRCLLGMDDSFHDNSVGEQHIDGNVEKGPSPIREVEDESNYPPLKTMLLSMLSIYFSFFLVALDRTIVGVAIPAISNDFQSFNDISWYEAAFLLAFCVLQFPIGKIYTFYSAKWTYIVLVAVFEIGSIVCAAAPTSVAFIIGRAITGIGGAGSLAGASVIMTELVPLQKRPKYQGLLGAIFGLSSIIGPLVGGVLTTKVSWRWCFWINVPIGGISLVGLLIFLPASTPPEEIKGSVQKNLWKFDPVGNIVLAPGLICLLLALQWGGTKYPWSDARSIALLVVGSVLLLAFVGIQWVQENGTIPFRIIRQRSIAAGVFVSLGLGAALIIPSFYLPIWFQAIKGTTAINAGIRILPLLLGTVVSVIGSGIVISKSGYYAPWLVVGCAIRVIGAGLLTTLRVDTGTGVWIGYQVRTNQFKLSLYVALTYFQIVVGVGTGMTLQQCAMAAQTVLTKRDVPMGLTIITFAQFFGGTISVSVCQTILANTLVSELSKKLPGFNASAIASAGATEIQGLVSKEQLPIVLAAYNAGIDNAFYCALAASSLAFVASLFVEWKSVISRP
ncbi:putative HC-toxin efflux carrier TOXA [Coleophoma cylindrospora]|uniref:Putative HC-toxin efflux carrier TOXA n=1 Tax=Coleophoma cylindrospora TaxID=1849047 RepID=A0A3D8Q503_9HELO|nr:putative HC-toxin efflux carrier TOXA [Coleophoma cylindrospora]